MTGSGDELVEVQDLMAAMLDHKKAVKSLIVSVSAVKKSRATIAMIGQECEPAFGWIAAMPNAFQIPAKDSSSAVWPPRKRKVKSRTK